MRSILQHIVFYSGLVSAILVLILFVSSCQKLDIKREPSILTGKAVPVDEISIELHGEIIDQGDCILEYGHCWSDKIDPTIENFKSSFNLESESKAFITSISDLSLNTKYYYRSYCVGLNSVVYGQTYSFKTVGPGLPHVRTGTIVTNDTNGITINSEILNLGIGSESLLDYGHCWSTLSNPTTNDYKKSHGALFIPTEFTSQLQHLSAVTRYYIRSYAVNELGTTYGNEISLISSTQRPIVSVEKFWYGHRAGCDLRIESTGGLNTRLFICLSKKTLPTMSDTVVMVFDYGNYQQTSSYEFNNLLGGEIYYFRAFVENENGGRYSTQGEFNMYPPTPPQIWYSTPYYNGGDTVDVVIRLIHTGGRPIIDRGVYWGNDKNNLSKKEIGRIEDSWSRDNPNIQIKVDSAGLYFFQAYSQNEISTSHDGIDSLYIDLN